MNDQLKTADLTPEQREVVEGFLDDPARVGGKAEPKSKSDYSTMAAKRVSHRRGSPLLWVKDSVTFGYSWWKVTWTDGGQQTHGYVFPNTAKDWGINRYYHTKTQHRFRGSHTVGAGTVTPWGDVDLYKWSMVTRIRIHHNGEWVAWDSV